MTPLITAVLNSPPTADVTDCSFLDAVGGRGLQMSLSSSSWLALLTATWLSRSADLAWLLFLLEWLGVRVIKAV